MAEPSVARTSATAQSSSDPSTSIPSHRFMAKMSFTPTVTDRRAMVAARRQVALAAQQKMRESGREKMREMINNAIMPPDDVETYGVTRNAAVITAATQYKSPASVAAPPAAATAPFTPAGAGTAPPQSVSPITPQAVATGARMESRRHRQRRLELAEQMMHPYWLEPALWPDDAVDNWMLLSRPEGLRCLVFARGGETHSCKKNGSALHPRFLSLLPHGGGDDISADAIGPAVAGVSEGLTSAPVTILDCVFSEHAQAYFILDVITFNNYELAQSDTEMRRYWLTSKIQDIHEACRQRLGVAATPDSSTCLPALPTPITTQHGLPSYPFHLLPAYPCRSTSFSSIYPHDPILARHGAKQDGYMLIHKRTHYVFGFTDLCLQWKDAASSSYLIDHASPQPTSPPAVTDQTSQSNTAAAPTVQTNKQMVTLRVGPGRKLQCAEGEIVGYVDEYAYQTNAMRVGSLVQYTIDGVDESADAAAEQASKLQSMINAQSTQRGMSGVTMQDEKTPITASPGVEEIPLVKLINLNFLKLASPARVMPDTLNKVVYQWHARTNQLITAETIMKKLQQQEQLAQHQQQQQQHQHPSAAITSQTASSDTMS